MTGAQFPWLSVVLFGPLAGAAVLPLIPRRAGGAIRAWTILVCAAVAVTVAALVASVAQLPNGGGPRGLHYEEHHEWIPSIGAGYHLGLDGISGWFLALNAGVFFLGSLVVSRSTDRLRFFCALLLITETATAGVLLSVDLLLFYLFWEAMLIPLYFLLSNYGDENRGRATLKFIIYTVAGSLLMLLAIIYLHFQPAKPTFDLTELLSAGSAPQGRVVIPVLNLATLTPAQFAFVAFALAFAIKVPLVPFHTWLPDLYTSCPTAALVFFAGIVGKLGAFGFIRYGLTLFPGPMRDMQWLLASVAVLSIVYGALAALGENDIKRIVAYASISHLGFVCLGIFSLNPSGLNGAVMQVVNHGIIIVALFLVVGYVEARTGTRNRHELAGLESRMPWLYALFLVITLAGLGMPGMNSFAGEFTIMLGAFQVTWVLAAAAGVGVVLACWYMLRLHQGLMHDPPQSRTENVADLRFREGLLLAPLVGLMIFLGAYPQAVTGLATSSVSEYLSSPASPAASSSMHPGGR